MSSSQDLLSQLNAFGSALVTATADFRSELLRLWPLLRASFYSENPEAGAASATTSQRTTSPSSANASDSADSPLHTAGEAYLDSDYPYDPSFAAWVGRHAHSDVLSIVCRELFSARVDAIATKSARQYRSFQHIARAYGHNADVVWFLIGPAVATSEIALRGLAALRRRHPDVILVEVVERVVEQAALAARMPMLRRNSSITFFREAVRQWDPQAWPLDIKRARRHRKVYRVDDESFEEQELGIVQSSKLGTPSHNISGSSPSPSLSPSPSKSRHDSPATYPPPPPTSGCSPEIGRRYGGQPGAVSSPGLITLTDMPVSPTPAPKLASPILLSVSRLSTPDTNNTAMPKDFADEQEDAEGPGPKPESGVTLGVEGVGANTMAKTPTGVPSLAEHENIYPGIRDISAALAEGTVASRSKSAPPPLSLPGPPRQPSSSTHGGVPLESAPSLHQGNVTKRPFHEGDATTLPAKRRQYRTSNAPTTTARSHVDLQRLLASSTCLGEGRYLDDVVVNSLIRQVVTPGTHSSTYMTRSGGTAKPYVHLVDSLMIDTRSMSRHFKEQMQASFATADAVLLPVHDRASQHWRLFRWTGPEQPLEKFDSFLGLAGSDKNDDLVVRFVNDIVGHCSGVREVPCVQQDNTYDCGLYVIVFAMHLANGWAVDFPPLDSRLVRRTFQHLLLTSFDATNIDLLDPRGRSNSLIAREVFQTFLSSAPPRFPTLSAWYALFVRRSRLRTQLLQTMSIGPASDGNSLFTITREADDQAQAIEALRMSHLTMAACVNTLHQRHSQHLSRALRLQALLDEVTNQQELLQDFLASRRRLAEALVPDLCNGEADGAEIIRTTPWLMSFNDRASVLESAAHGVLEDSSSGDGRGRADHAIRCHIHDAYAQCVALLLVLRFAVAKWKAIGQTPIPGQRGGAIGATG